MHDMRDTRNATPVMRHFHARSVVRNRDTHSIRWIFDADIAGVERFQAPRVSPLAADGGGIGGMSTFRD